MKRGLFIALMGVIWIGYSFATPVQDKSQICKRVDKKEFTEKLNSLENVQLIDVRTPGEFQGGTIKGAINIDYTSANFSEQIQKLDKSRPTLIFCQSGGRSAGALKKFKALGFDYVLELEGGYGSWQ